MAPAIAYLHYRHDYEFAVGHNVSAITEAKGTVCTEIATTWIPHAEVPRVAASTIANLSPENLEMMAIAEAKDAETIRQMIGPMVAAYESLIKSQQVDDLDLESAIVAQKLLNKADFARKRIAAGLTTLDDPDILTAFQIANRAIAL